MELAETRIIYHGVDGRTSAALQEILPSKYNYSISTAQLSSSHKIIATFQVNVFNESEAREWLRCLEEKTYTTYTVRSKRETTGTLVDYKCFFNCHHKSRSLQKNSDRVHLMKNTSCPSRLIITIKAIHKRWQGKGCKPDPSLPCTVHLDFSHNHALQSADVLRFRPVCEEVKAKLLDMFRKGHSPASALASHKVDIKLENEEFEQILADRKYCPDYGSCYRLYRKEFPKTYGNGDRKVTLDFLEKNVDDYNRESGSRCVILQEVNKESIIAICTPLMKRVHKKVKQASELVFVDSTGTADKVGQRVFQIMTRNEIGGLPLGILITESETTSTITAALQLLLEIVGEEGFFSRGAQGPDLFMTDDCDAEKQSLNSVWPSAVVLLCTFHVLQTFWRWMLKAKHGIPANERPALFYLFKDIVYATTRDECVDCYNELISNILVKKHPIFKKHVDNLWARKEEWATYFRLENHYFLTRGNTTNNYVESSMKILKDNVLEQVTAFNVVQLTDFILTRLDNYYERKLLDGASNRYPKKSQRFPDVDAITAAGIKQISQERFTVPSASSTSAIAYTVDLSIRVCTCVAGSTGAMCKHQHWVDLLYEGDATTVRSVSTRALCYEVATGKKPEWEWLHPLHDCCGDDLEMTAVKTEVEETASQVDAEGIDAASSPDTSTLPLQSCNERDQSIYNDDSDFKPTEQRLEGHRARGKEVIETIRKFLLSFLNGAPEAIEPALQHFNAELSKTTTTASLVSTLMTFGKDHIGQRKGARIPVQPTAVARQRTAISGRTSSSGGRPRTSNPASAARSSTQSQPPKRKAPHKPSECVAKNIKLGTTHS